MNSTLVPIWSFATPMVVASLLASGCYTGSSGNANADDGDVVDDSGDGASESGGADEPPIDCDAPPVAMPGLVRLTHVQYDATVRDLLGLDVHPSASFLPDPAVAGFDNNAQQLVVGDRLGHDYRRAAEELAAALTDEPAALADLLPCAPDAGDEACARDFIASFGRRVFRRPLADAEQTRYVELYRAGYGLYDDGTAFVQGIRVVVEALLQSPSFLWRIELASADAGADAVVPLTDYEIATRLSYLLWSSTPDDELLDAAEAGELATAEGVEAHARRLLADERAHAPVRDFHRQWLQTAADLDLAKDPELYPTWDPSIGEEAREETERFIERVVFDEHGGYADLMTSPTSVVDADLAAIYGIGGEIGDEFVPVDLDPAERAGLLTQVGFLASHAYTNMTSPIHRGVFLHRRILCTDLPDPPPGIDPTLPPLEGDIHTTRDAVEEHTSPASCSVCHSIINEPGFAFEGYDAIGRVRTKDNGWPVDTHGTIALDGADVPFAGAIELVHAIADSEQARRCYLLQWYRYANMRQETPDDACTLDALHAALDGDDYDVQELMVALTQTNAFRFRTAGGQ